MHEQLEEYLNAFALRLNKFSAAQREDQLREIRQHLEALVASHRKSGKSEEEAISLAIAQFGRAEKIGRDLNSSVSKSTMGRTATSLFAHWAVCTVVIYGFFSLMNDKPTDFPYHQSHQLILAAVMAMAGTSIKRLLEKKKIAV